MVNPLIDTHPPPKKKKSGVDRSTTEELGQKRRTPQQATRETSVILYALSHDV